MTLKKKAPPSVSKHLLATSKSNQLQISNKLRNTILALTVIVNLMVGYWAFDHWVLQTQQTQLVTLTTEEATNLAQQVSKHLQKIQGTLDRYSARPEFVKALVNNEERMLSTFHSSLRKALKNSVAVRIIPEGQAALENNTLAPIRFAELDMINRAEKREPVNPEATKVENRWLVNAVAPIPADQTQEVVGTLFVTISTESIHGQLINNDRDLGKIELLQKFERGKPQVLSSSGLGAAGINYDIVVQEAPVPDSPWSIRLTPSEHLVEETSVNPLPLLSALLVLLLISTIGLYVVLIRFKPLETVNTEEPSEEKDTEIETSLNITRVSSSNTTSLNQDILDIDVADEDQDLLGLQESSSTAGTKDKTVSVSHDSGDIPDTIFRSYDIRGIAGEELTPATVELIGQAIASEALDQGENAILVARDGRTHSPDISAYLIKGMLSTGCKVINLGLVPTPVLYYAVHESGTTNSGVMVTGSHNPAQYNGFKIIIKNKALVDDDIQQLHSRMLRQHFLQGAGEETQENVVSDYIDQIFSDVALAGEMSVVIDAGNGATGEIAPMLFEELGCEVIRVNCEIDGTFPNHDPDPTIAENLQGLIQAVQESEADLGVAFDGDGDRIMVVTPKGEIIWPDRLLMLFAKDIVSRSPGADVIFDVKCTRELNGLITSYGGRPIMWKSGHSHMKSKMMESGAVLGGEFSGHIFIKDRWYGFDDGMYAAARLIEIMSLRDQDLDSIFENFPALPASPELKISVAEDKKFGIIRSLMEKGDFQKGKLTTIDGLRVDFEYGWGLIRASNTSPALTARFEGESEEKLNLIKQLFKEQLLKIDSDLQIPY